MVAGLVVILVVRLHELVPGLGSLRPVLLLTIVGFGALIAQTAASRRIVALRDPALRWVLAYLIWATLTIPFALWRGLAFDSQRAVLFGAMLILAMLLLPPTNRAISRIVSALVISTAIYSIALSLLGREFAFSRLELGATLDSNDLAALMAMAFPFALGLSRRGNPIIRGAALGAAMLLVAGVTATGSRGGTIAIAIGALVYALGHRGLKKFAVLAILGAGGMVAWRYSPPAYRDRMEALLRGEEDYNYTEYTGRKQIWARGRTYVIEHPLLGVGIGNFPVAEGNYLERQGKTGKWSAPHNAYLQAFVELGVPGGVIFLGILGLTARRSARYWYPGRDRGAGQLHRPELLASTLALAGAAYFLSMAYSYTLFALVGIVALHDEWGAPTLRWRMEPRAEGSMRGARQRRMLENPLPGFLGDSSAPRVAR